MQSRSESVAILGAGNGGLALAGYLAHHGHRVSLWSRSPGRMFPIAAAGGIHLTLPGQSSVFTPIHDATCNIATALAGARHVVVAVPASGHADVARRCARQLRANQTVLLLPGRTGGALEFRRVLHEAGCHAQVLLGEANTFPFAARTVGPATSVIYGVKNDMLAAALPASRSAEFIDTWKPLLPMLSPAGSVLETGFANFGAILHPSISLLNAQRITSGVSFDFYAEGVTAAVAETLANADAERLCVARAYDVQASSLTDWVAASYGHRAETMQAAVGGNPAYAGIKAPNTLVHRYLLEDVPTGLIPLVELGAAAGIATPTLRRLARMAREVLGNITWQQPRTLAALGLSGLDSDEIHQLVESDVPPARRAIRRPAVVPMTHRGVQVEVANTVRRSIA